MHRRRGRITDLAASTVVLAAILATLAGIAAFAPAGARADVPTISAQVGSSPTGRPMPPGFVGVSFEYRAMHVYTGRDPGAVNPALVGLLRGLAPNQAPVLRIGGDSTDVTWWPMRGVIAPGGIRYGLTKGWLRTTRALAQTLGAKLIMGINLAANRPALAAAEARALLQGIGRQYIQALEIGNEPDLYNVFPWFRDRRGRKVFTRPRSYSLNSVSREFSRWRAAMPSVPLAGPTLSNLSWMSGLDRFISAQRRLAVVTFHRYPLRGCITDPANPSFASIANLLADSSSAGLAQGVASYVAVAHAHRLPFRLDELNSASCTGRRGTSDTFSAALWLVDTLFNMAAVGVDGVNLHSLPGAAYEPFTFTHDAGGWHAFVRPSYYGALLFEQAFPPGARLLPVSAPSGQLKVWATRDLDGRTRVVLINKQSDTPVQVQLQVPGVATTAFAEALSAPGLTATDGVTLAGRTFGERTDTGVLPGQPSGAAVVPSFGTYSVQVAPGSAVLLTF
ncbi:MAG: glycosyl hydrolase family 79 C-terminal domain-containing protein [Solirubrobacteraceae bacterium]